MITWMPRTTIKGLFAFTIETQAYKFRLLYPWTALEILRPVVSRGPLDGPAQGEQAAVAYLLHNPKEIDRRSW